MKIVHLCLGCFYPDGYSYQENMLPKFHKNLGYEVEVIASRITFDSFGKETLSNRLDSYKNEYDILVTRLDYRSPTKVYKKMKRYKKTYTILKKAQPDILFIHGCQFMDIDIVIKYIKNHRNIKVYVDNHCDFSNSGTNWLSKNVLHKIIWKKCAQMIEPYTEKFYGVLPARVDWLVDIYNLPREKCELLVMGADDEKVAEAAKPEIRKKIRDKYDIADDDFLIITGGKIDAWKKQTLLLMDAVNRIEETKIKLIVFGSVDKSLIDEVKNRCSDKVQYIGWIKAEESYKYFAASDLAVFPGRHSVFWEQVVGQGIPMLCKYWKGTTHIDLGGNVRFLYNDSEDEIYDNILEIYKDKKSYNIMVNVVKEKGMKYFSYMEIARKAIDLT